MPRLCSMPDARIWLVEDDPIVRKACAQTLTLAGWQVAAFADAESALAAFAAGPPAVVVSDVRLPGVDGLVFLRSLLQRDAALPVILMTGHGEISLAVEAMQDGAYDFIEKPFAADRLVDATRRALEKTRLSRENHALRSALVASVTQPLTGQSAAIETLRQLIASLAPSRVDVLVMGETGTGKEVVARALHQASGCRGPFVALNCAALPESMFESEMFGHEAGAFTGAGKRRIGKIEYADGGTLFLDEIESLPLNLQAKLLRVLQERTVERLGSNESRQLDLRVVAATKCDLAELAARGGFRADLYYRLHVAMLTLPPLRERKDDIEALMTAFIQDAAGRFGRQPPPYTAADWQGWLAHDWPGNVRELKHTAERFVLGLCPPGPAGGSSAGENGERSLAERVDDFERELIRATLDRCGGQVSQTAQQLNVPRKTLYDKMTRLGIVPESFRR